MWFLILSGTVAFLGGVLFLFFPNTLHDLSIKISRGLNRVFAPIDDKVFKLRIGVGISLLLISFMIFFVVYYLTKKYG